MLFGGSDIHIFCIIRWFPALKKINIGNRGNQNPPEGGTWLPVFPILIFVSRKPTDNAKMVNEEILSINEVF